MDSYRSKALQLNLSQALWQPSKYIAHQQAKLTVQQAEQQLAGARQELYTRLSAAWFTALQARDNANLAKVNVQTMQQLAEQTQREHELGIAPLTNLEEARAKYEQALAERDLAESQLGIKQAELEQIIGPQTQLSLPKLSEPYTSPEVQNSSLERWLQQAETGNPQILAAKQAVAIADEEIRKQRAGHQPTLDLVASYSNSSQGAGISGGQYGFDSKLGSVGIQLNAPLYAGGGQNAKIREALAQKNKAQYELEAAIRNVQMRIKQAWFQQQASRSQQQAAAQSLKRADFALKSTQAEHSKGVKVTLDVLQAQLQLNTAQRDLAKARYELLNSQLALKAATGQLSAQELANLDKLMQDSPQ